MWKLNFYKLAFAVVLFCYFSNETLGGIVVPAESSEQGEVGSVSPSSGKTKSHSRRINSSLHRPHHHKDSQKILVMWLLQDLNVTQPTVVVVHQLVSVPKTASSGFPSSGSPFINPITGFDSSSPFKFNSSVSSELQTTSSSGSDGSGSHQRDDLFSGLDVSTESGSTTQTETLSSSGIPGTGPESLDPDSSSRNVSSSKMNSSPSPEVTSEPESSIPDPPTSTPSSEIEKQTAMSSSSETPGSDTGSVDHEISSRNDSGSMNSSTPSEVSSTTESSTSDPLISAPSSEIEKQTETSSSSETPSSDPDSSSTNSSSSKMNSSPSPEVSSDSVSSTLGLPISSPSSETEKQTEMSSSSEAPGSSPQSVHPNNSSSENVSSPKINSLQVPIKSKSTPDSPLISSIIWMFGLIKKWFS